MKSAQNFVGKAMSSPRELIRRNDIKISRQALCDYVNSARYHCLIFDRPAHGRPLIKQGLVLRPDWEPVVRPVVDYALSRSEVDARWVALIGWSFGGYLAPRAASGEPRLAGSHAGELAAPAGGTGSSARDRPGRPRSASGPGPLEPLPGLDLPASLVGAWPFRHYVSHL
jgi:alpha-beta hydrolase superfamily lysophospholipase